MQKTVDAFFRQILIFYEWILQMVEPKLKTQTKQRFLEAVVCKLKIWIGGLKGEEETFTH